MAGLKLISAYGGSSEEEDEETSSSGFGAVPVNESHSDERSAARPRTEDITDSEDEMPLSLLRARKRTKKEQRAELLAKRRRLHRTVKNNDCSCRNKCSVKISKDDRTEENRRFWKLTEAEQDAFIRSTVRLVPLKRRNKSKFVDEESPKKIHTYKFSLQTAAGDLLPVCRKFYLNTLGYSQDCGNIIYRRINTELAPRALKRGRYSRSTDKRDAVRRHILTYKPTVSHYRRKHAPQRLYLPSDLSEKAMHADFLKSQNLTVSYEFYCRNVREMNIGLVKLGHEQCEACVHADLHQKEMKHETSTNPAGECMICDDHRNHLLHAKTSRVAYREDGEKIIPKSVVLSADLQKVIQLPRLEGLKSVVFSSRLLAYNETFAPVGLYARKLPTLACVWHEATSGRSANELISCFHRVLSHYSDMESVTIWLDNCSSQNKNWNLFLHLILLINSAKIQVKELILKFFESGHTFMSADSFHAAVEGGMKKSPPITFHDFEEVVATAKRKVDVLTMDAKHFFAPKFTVTPYMLSKCRPRPYIEQIRRVVIKKGSLMFSYSDTVQCEGELKACSLFSKKNQKLVSEHSFDLEKSLSRQKEPVGITPERKQALLKAVLPLVEREKQKFWRTVSEK